MILHQLLHYLPQLLHNLLPQLLHLLLPQLPYNLLPQLPHNLLPQLLHVLLPPLLCPLAHILSSLNLFKVCLDAPFVRSPTVIGEIKIGQLLMMSIIRIGRGKEIYQGTDTPRNIDLGMRTMVWRGVKLL
jgi:hypothetical protein